MSTKVATSLVALACLSTVVSPARGQDSAAADAAFREGRRLASEGRCDEALIKFEQSYELEEATGTLLNIGNCQAEIGLHASAWATFNRTAERAAAENRPKRVAEARRRATDLEPLLIYVSIETDEGSGLTITRDGVDVSGLVGVPVPVDPGSHVFVASRDGYAAFTATIDAVTPSERHVVRVPALSHLPPSRIDPVADERAVAAPNPSLEVAPRHPAADGARQRRLRYALGLSVVGGAALAGSIGSGVLARSAWNDSQARGCVEGRCTERDGFDLATRARRLGIASEVLAGVGGALALTAAVLWLTTPSSSQSDLGLSAEISGTGLSAVVSARF